MHIAISESRAHTRFERQTADGRTIWRTDYFGPPPSPASSSSVQPDAPNDAIYTPPGVGEVREPQAFLVEQSAGAIVHPHFHFVDQFQVVVDGGGTLGRHKVHPVSVHFAAGHTGYGPITPGPEGLKYFTLRASADGTGAQYLPANRHKMLSVPKKHALLDPIPVASREALRALGALRHDIFTEDESGLRVSTITVPPGVTTKTPSQNSGAGLMLLVLAGTARIADQALTRWSCLFLERNEPTVAVTAGDDGAQILALQFPSAPASSR